MSRALLASLLALAACAPPDLDFFQDVSVTVASTPEDAAAPFVEAIDAAQESVDICLPAGEDTAITDALIRAWKRGLDVRVATDIDQVDDPGFLDLADLAAEEGFEVFEVFDPEDLGGFTPDSGLSLADDGIDYHEFSINQPVEWDSTETVMTHAFVVTDNHADWRVAPRTVAASRVGDLGEGPRVVFDMTGEEIAEDFWIEQNQIYGGADAVAVTAYNSMAKSIADYRWRYPTASDVDVEVWFGPQERLTKRVIDAVYRTRSTIRVVTDDFTNDGLARALAAKAETGFEVTVIVGPRFGSAHTTLARSLTDTEDAGVEILQVTDVDVLPTLVLLDYEKNRLGWGTSRALILTHDLWAAARLYRNSDEILNDQLMDGTMLQLDDYDEPSGHMLVVESLWDELYDRAEAL